MLVFFVFLIPSRILLQMLNIKKWQCCLKRRSSLLLGLRWSWRNSPAHTFRRI